MFASCARSWKMIRLSPHICCPTATLVTGSRKGRRKPSRRKAEREAIRLVMSEPGGQHVRSKGHLLQICAPPAQHPRTRAEPRRDVGDRPMGHNMEESAFHIAL